jgi:hypothetical protein
VAVAAKILDEEFGRPEECSGDGLPESATENEYAHLRALRF